MSKEIETKLPVGQPRLVRQSSDTPETEEIITEWENLIGGEDILREYVEVKLLESHADLERERNEWKRRFADAVERMEGKLHCADGCKCSARLEVNQLRALLQSLPNVRCAPTGAIERKMN